MAEVLRRAADGAWPEQPEASSARTVNCDSTASASRRRCATPTGPADWHSVACLTGSPAGSLLFASQEESAPCTTRSFAAEPSSTAPANRPSPATSRSTATASPQVGGKAGPGKREINADGMLVTPGWVDVHTHYDGQATWDQELAPSSWHGVTTILFGNCGVGFAPVRRAAPRLADRPDGGGGGNPRHHAGRRPEMGLGELPAISRCAGPGCRARSMSRRRSRTIRCAST